MRTTTSFLVRAWDLIWQRSPAKAIRKNPWKGVPGNLTEYVGNVPIKPRNAFVSVELADPRALSLHASAHPNWYQFEDFVSLVFSFEWDEEVARDRQSNSRSSGLSEKKAYEASARFLSNIGNSIAQRLVILSNIAIPGLSSSRFSVNYDDRDFFEEGGACGSWLDLIYEDSSLYKTKPLVDIEIEECLLWGKNTSGIWSKLPKTNVEKCFSYFSHIFYDDYESHLSGVIWAMGALDAFYCDTSIGLSEKIKRRVPLILKGIDGRLLKKSLNKIYDDRSRVYHGDISFPAKFFDPYNELDESQKFLELFSSLPDLLFIVCGSLQYAVRRNARQVSFEEQPIIEMM